MHVAYAKLKTNRKQTFKDLFIRLCADPTPLVRKTSATNFGLFCKAIMHCEHRIPVEFLKSFTMLSTDDQVRCMALIYILLFYILYLSDLSVITFLFGHVESVCLIDLCFGFVFLGFCKNSKY